MEKLPEVLSVNREPTTLQAVPGSALQPGRDETMLARTEGSKLQAVKPENLHY